MSFSIELSYSWLLKIALLSIPVSSVLRELVVILELHLLTRNRIPTLLIELDILLATIQDQLSDPETFGNRIQSLDDS